MVATMIMMMMRMMKMMTIKKMVLMMMMTIKKIVLIMTGEKLRTKKEVVAAKKTVTKREMMTTTIMKMEVTTEKVLRKDNCMEGTNDLDHFCYFSMGFRATPAKKGYPNQPIILETLIIWSEAKLMSSVPTKIVLVALFVWFWNQA